MKVSVLALSILLASTASWASTPDSVGCVSSVLNEARKVYGNVREDQSMYPLQYEGAKVAIYGVRLEQNGGRMAIEAAVEKDTCKVLKLYTVWAD